MERGYRTATRTLGVATAVLGALLIAITLARGGGPLARGVLIGVAFLVVGGGRAYIVGRTRSARGRR